MTVGMTRSLIGLPLSLGRRGAGLALNATVGVAERGLSVAAHLANALLERDEPDLDFDGVEHRPDPDLDRDPDPDSDRDPDPDPARPPRRATAEAPPAPTAPDPPQPLTPEPAEPPGAPAEPAPEEEPRHVSEEATLVGEVAEPGAEDGAGAQVHVVEPWDGYRQMTASDVVDRITGADAALLAAVELYELSARGRQTVLEAVRRELARAGGDQ
jgi:hypothetical protein